jgi:hypothetical protein
MYVLCVLLMLFQNGEDTEVLGDGALSQGLYEQALEYYYRAYDTPIMFVKRARVLTIMRTKGLVCDYDAYIEVILEFLSWALQQDSSLLPVIVDDTVFHEVSRTVLFNIWKGCRMDSDSALVVLLANTTWYTHSLPITASGGQMVFHDDTTVYVDWGTYYEYDEQTGVFTAHPYGINTGRYSIEHGEIGILWDDGTTSVYTLELDYTLGILIDKVSGRKVLFDHPDECNT